MTWMVVVYIAILLGCRVQSASVPWGVTSCPNSINSCRSEISSNQEKEYVCFSNRTCIVHAAVLLPNNSNYIVNLQKGIKILKEAENMARDLNYLTEDIEIIYHPFDDKCDQASATIAALDSYNLYNAHVMFGPVCDYCLAGTGRITKFLGSYGMPLLTPGGFVYDFTEKKTTCSDEFYMIVNTGMVDFRSLAEFFVKLMLQYNWHKVALMYNKIDLVEVGGEHTCQFLMKSVMHELTNIGIEFDFNDGDVELLAINFKEYLEKEVGVKYGIIALCASQQNTRQIIIEAEKLKMMEKNEYLFFNFALYNDAISPFEPWWDPDDTDENNERARRGYKSLLTFIPATETVKSGKKIERGAVYLDGLFDAMMLYASVLKEKIIRYDNQTPKENQSLKGTEIVSNMWGKRFIGSKGRNVTMNCNGQRATTYLLMKMNASDKFDAVAKYYTINKTMVYTNRHKIKWDNGMIPLDSPVCGFDNSLCASTIDQGVIVICIVSFALLIIVALFLYRWYRIEADIASMTWKIPWDDIEFYSHTYFLEPLNKRQSLLTIQADIEGLSLAGDREIFAKVARYKGGMVKIRELNINKVELTRSELRELKVMKDLNNKYLTKFYGVCLDIRHYCILTEYCPKGSLQDILENDNLKLDGVFRMSLIHDIIKGMLYLHSSDIKSHGSLKSSNCVVDSRFVVKITDFGMPFLRKYTTDGNSIDSDSHEFWKRQLWTAPELLRSNFGAHPYGTQKGDVYSFGIIVHEIMTRQGVFYLGDHSNLSPKGYPVCDFQWKANNGAI